MTTPNGKFDTRPATAKAAVAALMIAAFPSISCADGWELRTTERAVPGTAEIEAGNTDKAIEISEVRLPHASPREAVAYLTNLCIGYILKKDFETAGEYCDKAVNSPTEKTVSLNNRGVLKALQGDLVGAIDDLARAASEGCVGECSQSADAPGDLPRPIARRNLGRAEVLAAAAAEAAN